MKGPGAVVMATLAAVAAAAMIVAAGQIDASELKPLLFALTVLAWCSFAVLFRAAARPPHIGALTERAYIAFTIAMLGAVTALLVINTDLGRPWLTAETSSLVFRLAIIAVLAIPTGWLLLWFLGKLGEAD